MGAGQRSAVMLIVAVVLALATGGAGATREGAGTDGTTSVVGPSPDTTAAARTTVWTGSAPSEATTSAPETTVVPEATTTIPATTAVPETTTTVTTTTVAAGATTTVPTTVSSTTAGDGEVEQLPPPIYLQGLCRTPAGGYVFGLSNLGTATVDVQLLFNDAPFDTVTLAPGELVGIRTDAPGTMVAVVDASSVATLSSDFPCPIEPGSIGLGGLCRDPVVGYQWLMGNAGPDPVDVEVRLDGSVVGTFTVESGGFTGFTTATGGQAQAFVGGTLVAEAASSDSPCLQQPAALGSCSVPGQGYRWFISNQLEEALTVEFRLDGVAQATLVLGPFEGQEVVTATGGLGELLVDGTVVASAVSELLVCETSIFLGSVCADTTGAYWDLGNGSADAAAEVRLVLDGAEVAVVNLAPGEFRSVVTPEGGTLEAFSGGQLVARAESPSGPCVFMRGVCADPVDGQVWALDAVRAMVAEVRIGGVTAGSFDLSAGSTVQFASVLPGTAQVFVDGVLAGEAEPAPGPCVELFSTCFDPALGYGFGLANLRDEGIQAEVRLGGRSLGVFDLEPFGFTELVSPTAGTAELVLGGEVVAEVDSSDEPCEPAVALSPGCFEAGSGEYVWLLQNQRGLTLDVELRLDGAPFSRVVLGPGEGRTVASRRPGVLQAYLNASLVAEAPSESLPCSEPPPSVGPGELPSTGGDGGGAAAAGLLCLVAGLLVLVAARRSREAPTATDHRTAVRGICFAVPTTLRRDRWCHR